MDDRYERDTAIHMASCFRNAGFPDLAQEALNNLKENGQTRFNAKAIK